MNRERTKKLMRHLAGATHTYERNPKHPRAYNHEIYSFQNGDPADITAYCYDLLEVEKGSSMDKDLVFGEVADPIRHFLGCTPEQARALYHGDFIAHKPLDEITPTDVIWYLKHLLKEEESK